MLDPPDGTSFTFRHTVPPVLERTLPSSEYAAPAAALFTGFDVV